MADLKLILTVTLNPAIDKIADVPYFRIGTENKALHIVATAGGKGINVARALKCLGLKSIATGFAGGASGQNLLRDLLEEGIENNFVFIQGETRVNVTVKDMTTGTWTRVLDPGPAVNAKDLASFRHKFRRLAKESGWIVVSGRGISGTPRNFYHELVATGRQAGARMVVDTSGEDLRSALKGKPFLVKPNREEAERILKQKLQNHQQLKNALKKFLRWGAEWAVITLDSKGAVGTDGKIFCYAVGRAIKAVCPVGSGDAFTAGLIYALTQNSPLRDTLAFAVAAGTANTLIPVPGQLDRDSLGAVLQKVEVKDF